MTRLTLHAPGRLLHTTSPAWLLRRQHFSHGHVLPPPLAIHVKLIGAADRLGEAEA